MCLKALQMHDGLVAVTSGPTKCAWVVQNRHELA